MGLNPIFPYINTSTIIKKISKKFVFIKSFIYLCNVELLKHI